MSRGEADAELARGLEIGLAATGVEIGAAVAAGVATAVEVAMAVVVATAVVVAGCPAPAEHPAVDARTTNRDIPRILFIGVTFPV